jgi:hypothetical protein
MSDVPATALWLAALASAGAQWRSSSLVAGLATAGAILVRPNLAPVAVPVALVAALAAEGAPHSWNARSRRLLTFVLAALPGPIAVAALNHVLYGAPLHSGYGDPALLFAWSHVGPNLTRYSTWLLETQAPWVLLGLLAPRIVDRGGGGREARSRQALAWGSLGVVATVWLLYLSYVVFENWTYLRFLLPGIVVLIVLSAAVTVRIAQLLPPLGGTAMLLAAALAIGWHGLHEAKSRDVFRLHLSEARFVDAGTWIGNNLPQDAVVFSIWHSGSIRKYGRRFTVLWDALTPAELPSAVDDLAQSGHHPYLMLEVWEVPRFRDRFSGTTALGRLDWPPRAQIGRQILLYDLTDRARYFRGEHVRTERVWTTEERAAFRHR